MAALQARSYTGSSSVLRSRVAAGATARTCTVCGAVVPPPGAGLNTVSCAAPGVATSAAAMLTASRDALRRVVGRSAPFQRTTALVANPLPYTIRVKPEPPAAAPYEERSVAAGTGFITVSGDAFEVPPPGAGFTTARLSVPAAVRSFAARVTRSCPPDSSTVGRAEPFRRASEPVTNPVPFTVTSRVAEPARACAGVSEATVGTGLFTWNRTGSEAPPPGVGFITLTYDGPAALSFAAGTVAVSCVELTYWVTSPSPFQRTTEPCTKPVPVTARATLAPPTSAAAGDRALTPGTGFSLDVPSLQAGTARRSAAAAKRAAWLRDRVMTARESGTGGRAPDAPRRRKHTSLRASPAIRWDKPCRARVVIES